mmetsp:Transcript_32173/g.67676  ORF Transcript_32173/g.67676 Transcript_32173/m.67676 type:complete len:236 (+) Transcript_32173:650-1357(+)
MYLLMRRCVREPSRGVELVVEHTRSSLWQQRHGAKTSASLLGRLGMRWLTRRQRAVGAAHLFDLLKHIDLLRERTYRVECGVRRALHQQQHVLALNLVYVVLVVRHTRGGHLLREQLHPLASRLRRLHALDLLRPQLARVDRVGAARHLPPSARLLGERLQPLQVAEESLEARLRCAQQPQPLRRLVFIQPRQEVSAVEGKQEVLDVTGVDVLDELVAREDVEGDNLSNCSFGVG